MKVLLAGYNVDADILKELKEKAAWDKDNITPETLSASYARISRDPRDISELRKDAGNAVAKARKSNEAIIFGLGHASVAEHAVFNFDIIGLSRLAVEEVQAFRIASFTEKSQRYITLEDDYIIPLDIKGTPMESDYKEIIKLQNEAYHALFAKLKSYLFEKYSDVIETKRGMSTVEGWAKEDARYVVSMATESQFGMTVNARSLENMLRKFRASKLSEVRTLAEDIYTLVKDFAPSIVKYTAPTDYDTEMVKALRDKSLASLGKRFRQKNESNSDVTKLLSHTESADNTLVASILYGFGDESFEVCKSLAEDLSLSEKEDLIRASQLHREFYDSTIRAYENIDFTFELTVSSSNFAQLKRHRIKTQLLKDYDTELGVTLPPNIKAVGMENEFFSVIEKTEKFYDKFREEFPHLKNYILTNAHRRKVLLKLNARELYHFVNLRDDDHAQWDIRVTAHKMKQLAEQVAPLTTMMLCSKSDFHTHKEKIFSR